MRFGAHMSIAGGFEKACSRAVDLGCETMQIFSRSPRSLRARMISESEVSSFKALVRANDIRPVVVHVPYLVNLASGKEQTYGASVTALLEDVDRCITIGADFLVIHPGSDTGDGGGRLAAVRRIAAALREAVRKIDGAGSSMRLLLENVAGGGSEIGSTFEELREITEEAGSMPALGYCYDTCHGFAAGYDIRTPEAVAETLEKFDSVLGLARLMVVHANDSMGALGTHVDRHAHIGDGQIGRAGFRALLRNEKLHDLPFILETPVDTPEDDERNLRALRDLAPASVRRAWRARDSRPLA